MKSWSLSSLLSLLDDITVASGCWRSKLILTCSLSGIAWLGGWIPAISAQTITWETNALAQVPTTDAAATVSSIEVSNFAQAALMIENERNNLVTEIGAEQVRGMNCGDVAHLNLPSVAEYCDRFEKIVQDNDLKVGRFNMIMRQQRNDLALRENIVSEMRRLCEASNNNLAPGYCSQLRR